MSLNALLSLTGSLGLTIDCDGGDIFLEGAESAIQQVAPMVKRHKHELLQVLQGDIVTDVGVCACGSNLTGLPSDGGFTDRLCLDCGTWATCLPPDWTPDDVSKHIAERSAIMEHDGGLPREMADSEAVLAVRSEFSEQKSIFDDADRIV